MTTLIEVLKGYEPEFSANSIDDRIGFDREVNFAMQALLNNDYLMNVARNNPNSLKASILNIAATGLTLNPVSQYAYLVPRKVNKKPAVCLDISYKGLIAAATESGAVSMVFAEVVYEGEELILNGVDRAPTHTRNPFDRKEKKVIGAYCVSQTQSGAYLTTTITWEELERIRSASEAFKKGYGPWVQYPNEMIKKAVIKRAAKTWPRACQYNRIENAINAVNEHEGIDFKKIEIEENKKMIDEDFKRNPDDVAPGLNYLFIWGNFKNKRIKDCDEKDLLGYLAKLEIKLETDVRYQSGDKYETIERLQDFKENREKYYEEYELEMQGV